MLTNKYNYGQLLRFNDEKVFSTTFVFKICNVEVIYGY